MEPPYLIQRGTIKRPIVSKDTRLSQAVDFAYMGSSEFEYGALSQSLRRIKQQMPAIKICNWQCRVLHDIKKNNAPLRVWSYISNDSWEKYASYLKFLRSPQYPEERQAKTVGYYRHGWRKGSVQYFYTKEPTLFQASTDSSHSTDFWWDITNDVMFGFYKPFMNRVSDYVNASILYMNTKGERGLWSCACAKSDDQPTPAQRNKSWVNDE
jgi:hypothetical protein